MDYIKQALVRCVRSTNNETRVNPHSSNPPNFAFFLKFLKTVNGSKVEAFNANIFRMICVSNHHKKSQFWALLLPLQGFHQTLHIVSNITCSGHNGIVIGFCIEINRASHKMFGAIGHVKL